MLVKLCISLPCRFEDCKLLWYSDIEQSRRQLRNDSVHCSLREIISKKNFKFFRLKMKFEEEAALKLCRCSVTLAVLGRSEHAVYFLHFLRCNPRFTTVSRLRNMIIDSVYKYHTHCCIFASVHLKLSVSIWAWLQC